MSVGPWVVPQGSGGRSSEPRSRSRVGRQGVRRQRLGTPRSGQWDKLGCPHATLTVEGKRSQTTPDGALDALDSRYPASLPGLGAHSDQDRSSPLPTRSIAEGGWSSIRRACQYGPQCSPEVGRGDEGLPRARTVSTTPQWLSCESASSSWAGWASTFNGVHGLVGLPNGVFDTIARGSQVGANTGASR
jgi:hypothetical protein